MVATRIVSAAVAALVLAGPVGAHAVELITNGDFETGTFAGWTVFDQAGGSGSFFIDDNDGSTPISGLPTVGPAGGAFYAVSDQTGPGAHGLLQTFIVPVGVASLVLSYDFFINDLGGGPIIDPGGLDYTLVTNQHARIDILTAAAGALSTAAADIVTNIFLGSDSSGPNGYTPGVQDLSGVLMPGTYQVRFAEVDNQSNFNFGVDNVSITATAAVPEPAVLALVGMGMLGVAAMRRRNTA